MLYRQRGPRPEVYPNFRVPMHSPGHRSNLPVLPASTRVTFSKLPSATRDFVVISVAISSPVRPKSTNGLLTKLRYWVMKDLRSVKRIIMRIVYEEGARSARRMERCMQLSFYVAVFTVRKSVAAEIVSLERDPFARKSSSKKAYLPWARLN